MSATAVVSSWEYAARLFEPKPRRYATPLALARHLDPRTGFSDALRLIDQALVDLMDTDEHDALLVTIPPQEGKSTTCARRFPEWLLTDRPELRIAIVCYEAETALRWGRDIKRDIELAGDDLPVSIRADSSAGGQVGDTSRRRGLLGWCGRPADRPPRRRDGRRRPGERPRRG